MIEVVVKSAKTSNTKHLIQAALDHELRVLNIGIEKTRANLSHLEEQFGMKSPQFYQQFQLGTMGDNLAWIKWAGEYETYLQLRQDYAELREIRLY